MSAGTPRDFRMGDWGEPEKLEGEDEVSHLRGVRVGQVSSDEDFRDSEWGTPENAQVVTPGAIDKMPAEDDNKSTWESYAQQKGYDTNGLNKEQIIAMVEEGQQPTGTQETKSTGGKK